MRARAETMLRRLGPAMGTRINILFEHNLTHYRDRESVLARLSGSLPITLAVQDYWRAADRHCGREIFSEWRADPLSPCDSNLHKYTAPGSLFLTVTKQAAHIRTGGRWRGFLEIEALRLVHLAAFRQIAAVLGAKSFALYPDSCEVNDLFWNGHSQWECVELMERMWGPPQRSVDAIDEMECIAADSKWTYPFIWFLESIQAVAE